MSAVPPVLLIDGRSGTGKTTLASSVASALTASTVVHMDDLYPGWEGLDEGARLLVEWILEPFAERRAGEWRRWDWERSARAEAHHVPSDRPLIVEGCGSSSRSSRVCADTVLWLDAPVVQRTDRLIGRGDGVDWLADWTLQEDAFIERERPDLDAGLRIEATGAADQVSTLVLDVLAHDSRGRWNPWLRE
jgi:cytidylate kinase